MTAIPSSVGTNTNNSTSAFNLDWPAGQQTNDLALVFVESSNETVTIPTGFTELASSPQGAGVGGVDTTAIRITGFYKVATSGAEATIPIADPGDHALATIHVFRGVDPSTPIHASFGSVIGTAQTSVNGPAISTTTDNCLIVFAAAQGVDNSVTRFNPWFPNAVMSNFTGAINVATAAGNGGGIIVGVGGLTSAGSSSAATTTLITSSFLGYLTVALQPAPPSQGSQPIVPYALYPYPSGTSWVWPYPITAYGAS